MRQALKHKLSPHRVECAEIGDQVYYKKDKEGEWRRLGKMIGEEKKMVVVKQGGNMSKMHITRLRGKSEEVI